MADQALQRRQKQELQRESTRPKPEARYERREESGGGDGYLYPVGRLDLRSSGILLLTNDGAPCTSVINARTPNDRILRSSPSSRSS